VARKTREAARRRGLSTKRHSLIERLEPRVVLNGAPVAVPDPWYSTPLNTTLNVTTQGTTLLANDWDPESSSLSASLVSGPSHGTLGSLQANGTFSYTPTTGYRGFDSFMYRVSDGSANSNTVAALIAVGGYLGPRTNHDGSAQDLALLHGSLELVEPLTPDVTLTYQSDTQAGTIVVVETSLLAGGGVPSQLSAQLTFNGVAGTSYGYSTTGLTDGRTLRFALQADTSALATGRYNWQLDVTTTYSGVPTVHSFTGSTNVVNRNSASAPFGRGWQLSGLDQLSAQTGGVLLVRGSGTTLWFADDGAGGYLHAEGDATYSTLVKNGDQTYTLSDTHGTETNFSTTGLLASQVDANSNTTSYTYTSGLVTQTTDAFGRATDFTYTSGRLTSVTDFASRTATLAYDANGRLASITQPDPDGGGALAAPVTSFSYDATSHRLTGATNALNQTTGYAYGTHGRLTTITQTDSSTWPRTALVTVGLPTGTSGNTVSQANPTGSVKLEQTGQSTFRTDRFGHVTQWIDALTHSTLIERNADGLGIRLTEADPDGSGPATRPLTVFGYDALGSLVYRKNPDGYSATWTYTTSLNQVATATDELNQVISFGYDSTGNMTSSTDAAGYVTSYTYNSRGLPTSITTPDPDGTGPLSAAVTGLAYDSYGRLTTLTNPDNTTLTFGYNTADQLTSETDELSHTTTFVYDTLNRLTSQTDRVSAQTSYVYDAVGQLVRETNALGGVTDYTYNNRGWLTTKCAPDPDGSGSLERPESVYGYDTGGHLVSMGLPDMLENNPVEYGYDSAGRRTFVRYAGDSTATTFAYDNLNRLIQVTDQLSNTTAYTYNWRGRVTQEVDSSDALPQVGVPLPEDYITSYEYDPTGQLITETDPRGSSTKYVYDARGLLSTLWFADPDGEDPNTTGPQFRSSNKYTYDHQGRLLDIEETQLRHTSATYDSRDRMTQVTLPDPDGSGSLTSATIGIAYDNAGRLASRTDELGNVTSYTYDHEGRVLSLTGPDPDGAGSLTAPVESYTYNALGSVLTMTDAGGHVTSGQYDALQRLTRVTEPDPDGGGSLTAPVTTYTYGANTRLSQITDAVGRDVIYEYDSRGRRTGVTDELGNETTYAYDALGRLTIETNWEVL
jgi:YD repeat-containing protein